jgi:hypothetical protein
MESRIAVTFDIGGWRAMDIGCDGLLDYAEFTHYPNFRNSAKMHIGPIHQDCTFRELIAGLPPMDSESVEVQVGVDRWEALQYAESHPDWSYLGVRLGPNSLGAGHLYLINGDERNYFAFITAPAEVFDEFVSLTSAVLASLELDVED